MYAAHRYHFVLLPSSFMPLLSYFCQQFSNTLPAHTNAYLLVLERLQLLHLLLPLQPLLCQTSCLLLERLYLALKRTRAGCNLVGEKKGKQCQAVIPRMRCSENLGWWVRSPEKEAAVRN